MFASALCTVSAEDSSPVWSLWHVRTGANRDSRRAPTNAQGLVPTGPAIVSEGLQVGVLVPTHGGLVGGRLMLVQDPQVLQALGVAALEIPQGFGGFVRCPLRVPGLYAHCPGPPIPGGLHAATVPVATK